MKEGKRYNRLGTSTCETKKFLQRVRPEATGTGPRKSSRGPACISCGRNPARASALLTAHHDYPFRSLHSVCLSLSSLFCLRRYAFFVVHLSICCLKGLIREIVADVLFFIPLHPGVLSLLDVSLYSSSLYIPTSLADLSYILFPCL
jgi:hypothetical protein